MNAPVKNDRAAWLCGPSAKCSLLPKEPNRAWRLVLLGAPGVGKGTQAELLGERLGVCHLSTGDIFREAASPCNRAGTPAMTEALRYMRDGRLVPDSIVWEIVRERAGCIRCRGGFVLDGFPRTLMQARALQQLMNDEGLCIDGVLNYVLPVTEIVLRLSGRRVCEKCKAVFHVTQRAPRVPDVCDQCGGHLIQREDDRPESVKVRLQTYERATAPLIEFYRGLGKLVQISAAGSAEEVFARSLTALEAAITDGLLRSRNPREAIIGLGEDGHSPPRHIEPL
ncbi:MAG: nucleoside monophosphate kinase [Tepidisphaeraceae bacterium]